MFQKKNGSYSQVKLTLPQNFRMPYIETSGQDQSLKADVIIKLEYPASIFNFDTIMYQFYIYDRALHKSNVASTPDLVIKKIINTSK